MGWWALWCSVLLTHCCADSPRACWIAEDRLAKAEEFLKVVLCKPGPSWALAVKRELERELVTWDSEIFYMVFESCGFAATALRVALRITEFPVTSHMVLGMFGWVDSLKWKQLLLNHARPFRFLGTPWDSNWVPLLFSLYAVLSDLWAQHTPQESHTSILAAELQSHYASVSKSLSAPVFCHIPPSQTVLEPRRMGVHSSLRYLMSYSTLVYVASAQTLLLSACITEQLAWEARSPEQAAAFLMEGLYNKQMGVNQLSVDILLTEAPVALGLLHRYMLLSEEQLSQAALPSVPTAPPPKGDDRELAPLQAYQALYTASVLLDHFEVDWWMTHGSLLGALRNGGIIPHDGDIDVAISHEQLPTLVSVAFKQALVLNNLALVYDPPQGRFRIVSHPELPQGVTPGYSLPGQILPAAGVILDLWLFGSDATGKVLIVDRPFYKPHMRLTLVWEELHPEPRTERRALFGEVEVRVPGGGELFLDQLYGEDWRTHVRHGDTVQDFTPLPNGAAGPMKGPTGPLNRVVQLTADKWLSGSPPVGLFGRSMLTTT